MNRPQSLATGVLACVALVSLTAAHLESQGPYYDELHQAPAAFSYVGKSPILFTHAYRGIPILNMTYSGAIKSGVYGLYLRYVDPHFRLVTWRLLGIAFVAVALLLFFVMTGPSLPLESAFVLLCLFLSDVSVIIMTRHDAGPTALALALRLVFLALWISIALDRPTDGRLVLAGLVTGISIWEKLSSIVLLVPLCILVLTVERRRRRAWLASASGLVAGTLPLLAANVGSYARGSGFVSLRDAFPDRAPLSLQGIAGYVYRFLSLGQGQASRVNVLGQGSSRILAGVELVLVGSLVLGVLVAGRKGGRRNPHIALAATMAGTYAALALALAMLPRKTSAHHWIIGTPFQYAAIALALAGLNRGAPRRLLLAASVCLIAIRVPALVEVERSFLSGRSSASYDPAFNRLMRLAALRSDDAAFIATDWGSATQVYCGSNGRDDAVFEPYWSPNPGRAVREILEKTAKRTLYLVTTGLGPRDLAEASSAILEAMAHAPDWKSVPVEPEFTNLGPVRVRKFVRRAQGGLPPTEEEESGSRSDRRGN